MAFAIALKERRFRPNEENIQVAVTIEIQKGTAVPNGLEDVQGTLARNLPQIVEAGGCGYVLEVGGAARAEACCAGRAAPRFRGAAARAVESDSGKRQQGDAP